MTEVEIIETPSHDGKRTALVLAEDRVGHYPEFREFFIRRFSLDANGLSKSGYIRGPSGMIYFARVRRSQRRALSRWA